MLQFKKGYEKITYVKYENNNIHTIMTFIEKNTGHKNSVYLKYSPEQNEYKILPFNLNIKVIDTDKFNLTLKDGYYFVMLNNKLTLMDSLSFKQHLLVSK